MCGRSSLTKNEKEIEERFNATFYSDELFRYNPFPTYNVAPTHMHPVITNEDPSKLRFFSWGLIPSWSKDRKIASSLINARSESVLEKVSFRKAMESRRCLVPFDGYYEWNRTGKNKIPFYITTTNVDIFTVAGLWEKWISNDTKQEVYSFTILTQSPNELLSEIHDRMPAILLPEQEKLWIDNSISANEILKIIEPYPAKWMKAVEVGSSVGSVKNNNPSLIQELPDHQKLSKRPKGPIQGELF